MWTPGPRGPVSSRYNPVRTAAPGDSTVVDHTPSDDRLGDEPAPPDGIRLCLPGRFHAAVFDMDGLLVDTESMWAAASLAELVCEAPS